MPFSISRGGTVGLRFWRRSASSKTGEMRFVSSLSSGTMPSFMSKIANNRTNDPLLDPQVYTSGKWLHLDDAQQRSRRVDFDFPALLQKAIEASPGASKVVAYEEKVEGGYNRAFVLRLDNGCRVVAKIPFHHSGPAKLTTNSEVATISYLRKHTSIPLPTILAWSDDSANTTGTEYIIMSHVAGMQLHKAWPHVNPRLHFASVRSLVDYMCELSKLSFPAYGSIYFEDGPLSTSDTIGIGDGFCIGPACHPQYWPGSPGEPKSYTRRPPNRGPWRDLKSYVSGLIDNGYSLLPDVEPTSSRTWHGSVSDHLQLLRTAGEVVTALADAPQITAVATPRLLHPDYAKRNVFIDDSGTVTGIIDWQFATVLPTFAYADDRLDFLYPHEDPGTIARQELASNADEDAVRTRTVKVENRFKILQKLYSVGLQASMRELHQAVELEQTMLRPFRYCGASWRDGAPALHEELIKVSRQWSSLGLPGNCPYPPTAESLEEHAQRFEDLNAHLQLKMAVVHATDSDLDGWVESENYEAAVVAYRQLYAELVEKETGALRQQTEAMWPFDLR